MISGCFGNCADMMFLSRWVEEWSVWIASELWSVLGGWVVSEAGNWNVLACSDGGAL